MKLGILSDIHEANDYLTRAIDELTRRGVEQFVLLGDLFETGKLVRKRSRRERRLSRIDLNLDHQPDHKELADNSDRAETLLLLDQALTKLAIDYPTHAKVVELKYFGGLTIPQCAQQLRVSEPTIERYWAFARKWLAREVQYIAGQ